MIFNFLNVLLLCPVIASAHFVVLENSTGESYVLEVDRNEAFFDVISLIDRLKSDEGFSDNDNADVEAFHSFKISIPAKSFLKNEIFSKKIRTIPRNYLSGITSAECGDIALIIKTLANNSLTKIKSAESSLKKAGDRIDHVHPLQFLACIFTNEELKVCMRNLQGRSWVWKDFLKGVVETLSAENSRENVLPFLADFASRVKVDVNALIPIAQAGRWERFVNMLIDTVPREGGGDRYNQ